MDVLVKELIYVHHPVAEIHPGIENDPVGCQNGCPREDWNALTSPG